jgi:hypothetical protein
MFDISEQWLPKLSPVALSTFVEEAPHGSVHKTPMTLSTRTIHPTAKDSYDINPQDIRHL